MKIFATAGVLVMLAGSAYAQQPAGRAGGAAQPTTDLTKATVVKGTDLQAILAKQPNDKPNSPYRLFSLAGEKPYSMNIEHRTSMPQSAAIHDNEAELFYVVDGSATLVTGGTIPDGTRNGANVTGKTITGGTSAKIVKGDWIMVPEGVAHWFSQVDGTAIDILSFHLPRK